MAPSIPKSCHYIRRQAAVARSIEFVRGLKAKDLNFHIQYFVRAVQWFFSVFMHTIRAVSIDAPKGHERSKDAFVQHDNISSADCGGDLKLNSHPQTALLIAFNLQTKNLDAINWFQIGSKYTALKQCVYGLQYVIIRSVMYYEAKIRVEYSNKGLTRNPKNWFGTELRKSNI
jgi:hypothetical protein